MCYTDTQRQSTDAPLNDTIMGCSGLLTLGLALSVGFCLELQGKSAGLKSICDTQLYVDRFCCHLRSCLNCGVYTRMCCNGFAMLDSSHYITTYCKWYAAIFTLVALCSVSPKTTLQSFFKVFFNFPFHCVRENPLQVIVHLFRDLTVLL